MRLSEAESGASGGNTGVANTATEKPKRPNTWYPVRFCDDPLVSLPIDWVCPKCDIMLRGGKSCPNCGLVAREHPPEDQKYQHRKNVAWARFGHRLKY